MKAAVLTTCFRNGFSGSISFRFASPFKHKLYFEVHGLPEMILTLDPEHPQPYQINRVAQCLRDGGVIAYPTDTTYGIGCSIFNKKGIERIYRMKGRERNKPFSFICSTLSEVTKFARVTNVAFKYLKRY